MGPKAGTGACGAAGAFLALASAPWATQAAVDFREHVAPILIRACVRCHNEDTRKGKLSLTTAEAAFQGGKKGAALVPGDPGKSLLLKVITGPEPSMPEDGEALREGEVAVIRAWVEQGSPWPKGLVLRPPTRADGSWWSLQPVRRPAVPAVPGKAGRNPIDAFVGAALAEKGLSPSAPASPRTLVRRMHFDLVGLPPTPAQVAAFEAAAAADMDAAVDRLADELLASPRHGERWATHWLDVAHYADTHGFERDMRRDHAWRYRDYVIQSLNDDKPYDRFLLEQVAGDVVAERPGSAAQPPTVEGVVATGFLAAGPFDFVGQVETASPALRAQARGDDLDDMVTQVISATVGLTINCARCHDHKLDPITTNDYYGLWAVFAGVRRGDRELPGGSSADIERRGLQDRLATLDTELARLDGRGIDLADLVGGGDGSGVGRRKAGIDPRDGKPASGNTGFIDVPGNTFVKSSVPFIDGVAVPAARGAVVIDSAGLKLADLPATTGKTWDHVQDGPVHSQHTTRLGDIDYAAVGHSLLGLHANKIITFDLDALRKRLGADGSLARMRLTATAGSGGKGGDGAVFGVYLDGKPAFPLTTLKPGEAGVPVLVEIGPGHRSLTLVSLDGGRDISHDQVFLGDARLRPGEPEARAPDHAARRDNLRARRAPLAAALAKLPPAGVRKVFAVVPQQPPLVRVLRRGDPGSPDREAPPSAIRCVPTAAPGLGDSKAPEGERRLALARWITDPANPLTRRVIVNRLWHHHFGAGIVATPSDFGFAGGRPSHPGLLDWLAEELLARGWSLKAMHKLIVTSRTYRQSSARNPGAARIDAGNRLLWRMSPRRLEAEALRDAVLSVAGTLDLRAGGPGFEDFTYREEYAPVYRHIPADRPPLWRRTVYRYVVRTTQNEFLRVFDCPDPSALAPARNRTTTALQALSLMNNRFMVDQAGHFAARLGKEAGPDAGAQARLGFTLVFGRPPAAEELAAAEGLAREHGLACLCRMLLNANEFIHVD